MRQPKRILILLGALLVGTPALAAPDADTQKAIALFKVAFEGRCADDAFTPSYLDDTEGVPFTYRMSERPYDGTPALVTVDIEAIPLVPGAARSGVTLSFLDKGRAT